MDFNLILFKMLLTKWCWLPSHQSFYLKVLTFFFFQLYMYMMDSDFTLGQRMDSQLMSWWPGYTLFRGKYFEYRLPWWHWWKWEGEVSPNFELNMTLSLEMSTNNMVSGSQNFFCNIIAGLSQLHFISTLLIRPSNLYDFP